MYLIAVISILISPSFVFISNCITRVVLSKSWKLNVTKQTKKSSIFNFIKFLFYSINQDYIFIVVWV